MDPPPYEKAAGVAPSAPPAGFVQPYPGQAMPAYPQQAPMAGGYPQYSHVAQMGGYPGQQQMPVYGGPSQQPAQIM